MHNGIVLMEIHKGEDTFSNIRHDWQCDLVESGAFDVSNTPVV